MPEYDLSNASWFKSSYSNGEGGNCVEVAYDFPGAARWRKSTYSDGNGGNCVEVADGVPGAVPVRDSKLASDSPVLVFPAHAWSGFVSSLK
ncbi:DUF397 domain-containing protein [Streptomyces curacoi]|uniref:Toxin n=1 Tax=Streptomyces curacoi TaxID=146536 RepID=A0A117PII1_9ACTN|nr:DUF397 domain-containing protein [Streptomyces curacoi]KUM80302.1 toxin [Streptomyces curacoi]